MPVLKTQRASAATKPQYWCEVLNGKGGLTGPGHYGDRHESIGLTGPSNIVVGYKINIFVHVSKLL